jgi:hypothetical protein
VPVRVIALLVAACVLLPVAPASSRPRGALRATDGPSLDPVAGGPRFSYLSTDRVLRAKLAGRTAASPSPSRGPAPLAPVETGEFDAITGSPSISPSDSTGAVGPAHIVTAVNIRYAVWDKTETDPSSALVGPNALSFLFPGLPPGAVVFDPKVVYDHYRGRFILVFLAATGPPFTTGDEKSWILLVSIPQATADSPSTWCRRRLGGDQLARKERTFADYPGLGFDGDRVYVTTNQFTFGNQPRFRYAQILALPKGRLYNCDRDPKIVAFGRGDTRDPQGTKAFTIQPAITQTETGLETPGFLLSFQGTSCGPVCGHRLTLWRISRRSGALRLKARSMGVGRAKLPPLGTQKDGSPSCADLADCWDTGDLRLTSAFYDADRQRLYAAHTVRRDVAPGDGYLEAAIRWYEVDPQPFSEADDRRRGVIGASLKDAGWPAIGTDGARNVFVTYSRAGALGPDAEYLSAVAATIAPGTTAEEVAVLKPGEALYRAFSGIYQRWGDYNAISRDPLDPVLMVSVNQYARDDGPPPRTRLWQQVVHRLAFT